MQTFRIEAKGEVEGAGATLAGETRAGDGTALVLIHGFGGSRRDWDPVIAGLPGDLPLVAYDQRGFGQSPARAGAVYSHADDLLALLDALGLEQVDLCGLSLGGATALNFALDHPARVRRLVLASPLMVGWGWSADWIARWKAIGSAARAGDMALARDLWWRHPLFDTTRKGPGAEHLRQAISAYHGSQWVADNQRRDEPDLDRLDSLRPPTLLLTGARDTADFLDIAAAIAGRAPDVRHIVHDAGHLLNLEIPDRMARSVAQFLGRD